MLLFVMALVGIASAHDVTPRTSIQTDYNLTVWTEREGLRSPRVWSMAQTTDGYLWLGTSDGLIRFDGTTFMAWDEIGSLALPTSRATLWANPDGSLWVGYVSGTVAKISGSIATIHDGVSAATGGTINSLLADRNGTLWIAARNGLVRVDGDRTTTLSSADGLPPGPVLNAYEDRDGALWISSNTGVYRKRPDAVAFELVMSASYFDHRVTVDDAGTVWVTDPRSGFRQLTEDAPSSQPARRGLGVQILPGDDNELWVATLGQGLWRVQQPGAKTTIEVIGKAQGLLNETVRCVLEDRERNIWVGSDYGLYRLSPNKLTPIQDLGVVRVLQADSTGVWVGTSDGLIRIARGEQRLYGRQGELPSPFVSALHLDRDNSLWVATDRGIAVFDHGRFRTVRISGIEGLNRIYSMTRDSAGRLWLADYNRGLFRSDASGLQPVDVAPTLDHRAVLSVHADMEGRIWLSLSDGRIGFLTSTDTGTQFTLPDFPREDVRLNTVLQRQRGEVWLITSEGVWRYKDGEYMLLSERNGLPSSQNTSAAFDKEGALWLGTSAGIVRVDQAAIDRVTADPSAQITYGYWDAYDGAAGAPIWYGTPPLATAPDGRLWFVTANGVSVADPRNLKARSATPPVMIQSLSVGSRRFAPGPNVTLPPRSSPIEIDYATVLLSSAHKVRFRYRLENFETNWTEAGTRRQALFTNLPPGDYTFRVMGVATDGLASESSASLRFTVRPAFTQTPIFYASLLVLLALTVWEGWRLRVRYLQRRFALVINERIRLSREIHDTLLQSLIGVALRLDVAGAGESVPPDVRSTLTRLRRELEDDIRDTRQSIWNLRSAKSEQTDLPSLIREAGQRLTASGSVQFNLTVNGRVRSLRADIERQVLRIAEQAIVNAVRHAAASTVDADLTFTTDSVRLTVVDNGCGFDESQSSPESNLHYGLASMRERAAEAGGRLTIHTQPGSGTSIDAVIPA